MYRIAALDLFGIPEARNRILRLLAQGTALPLDKLLPDAEQLRGAPQTRLRLRSAWTSTFVAGLELARQGEVTLAQAEDFGPIIASGSADDLPLPRVQS